MPGTGAGVFPGTHGHGLPACSPSALGRVLDSPSVAHGSDTQPGDTRGLAHVAPQPCRGGWAAACTHPCAKHQVGVGQRGPASDPSLPATSELVPLSDSCARCHAAANLLGDHGNNRPSPGSVPLPSALSGWEELIPARPGWLITDCLSFQDARCPKATASIVSSASFFMFATNP